MDQDWNKFLDDRMESIWKAYIATKEGQYRRAEEANSDQLLTSCLNKTDRSLVEEILSGIYVKVEEDGKRLYQQGMRDYITILRLLGVLE